MSLRFTSFAVAKLADHARIQAGFPFKSERFTSDPADVPLVKGENVQQGYVDWGASKYWPQPEADAFAEFVLGPGDVVVAMDRPWVQSGLKWAYIKVGDPKALLVQRVAALRGRKTLDQTYLRCLISSGYFANYIQPIVTGVNVPHISPKQIGAFLIPLPPLPVQRKIAAILSAYDDLITNNQRRIALLESMAEEIYREWFVRMRFPGHESTKVERGLPRGWRDVELQAVANVNANSVKRRLAPEWIEYLDISAVTTNAMSQPESVRIDDAPGRARRIAKHGDVIWSTVRPANRAYALVLHPAENLIVSTGFAVISPKLGTPYTYLHQAVTTNNFVEQMVAVAKGSAYPATAFDDFAKAKIIWPSDDLLRRFHELAEPMALETAVLRKRSVQLSKLRDALLPRLISGKLKVDHLDIQFPPSMREKVTA